MEQDKVIDVIRTANGGEAPITFGDFGIDDEGKEYPLETEMVAPEDHCSKQCLDYIFEIKRSFQMDHTERDTDFSFGSRHDYFALDIIGDDEGPMRNRSVADEN